MSYTTMYLLPEKGEPEVYAEFGNAWLSAMYVWTKLQDVYIIPPGLPQIEREMRIGRMMMSGFKEIFALQDDDRLSREELVTLLFTFDKVIIRKDECEDLADCLNAFRQKYPDGLSHLPAIADALRAALHNRDDFMGVGFQQTSVAEHQWSIWSDCDEDGEPRPFDASKDLGADSPYWFLFDHVDDESEVST